MLIATGLRWRRRGTIDRGVAALLAFVAVFVGVLATLPVPRAAEPAAALPGGRFAVTDVTVFDGSAFKAHHDVWVEDGRIHALGRRLDLPEDLPRVDGRGRTLLPGLIDGHVHTFGSVLEDALRFGVTTVLDQFTALEGYPDRVTHRQSVGHDGRADLFSAGMLATAPGGHGTQYGTPVEPVTSPGQAEAWVRARKAEGSDWIKIVIEDGSGYGGDLDRLDAATIRALIDAAHREGLLAVAHVSRLADALFAMESGIDGLAHVWGDAVIATEDAERMGAAELFVVPTLAVISALTLEPGSRRLAATVDPALLSPMQRLTLAGDFGIQAPEQLAIALENVRRLHAAKVPLVAGSDAPNPGTAAGLSVHAELRLLAQAGLAAEEVLAAATVRAARAFGIDDRGAVDEGQLADLLLVDGDLSEDLARSHAIAAIWKDGEPVARALSEDRRAVEVAKAPDDTRIADFEDGIGASFGLGWFESTDGIRGGNSVAGMRAVDGALAVSGEVREGFPFPWSGVIWFPGAQPMSPVDFGDRSTLRFRARGDGRRYTVMVFGEGVGAGPPPSALFDTDGEWRTVEMPLAAFGSDGIVSGIAFVAQLPLGAYAFEIDDVVLE